MMRRCGPECINERMAASSRHTVRVQKARSASRRTETARLPAASLAWRAARKDWITNPGRYRQDRTRSRVIDTKGIVKDLTSRPTYFPLLLSKLRLPEKIESGLADGEATNPAISSSVKSSSDAR